MFRHITYAQGGCRNAGYTPIAASGPNGAVLHYGHAGAPNDRRINSGDMLLLDMGGEYHRYTSGESGGRDWLYGRGRMCDKGGERGEGARGRRRFLSRRALQGLLRPRARILVDRDDPPSPPHTPLKPAPAAPSTAPSTQTKKDITTSFPAGGKFSADQALVYSAVLDAHQSVLKALRPGVAWPQMQTLAYACILKGLKAGGLLAGEVDEMLAAEVGALFMPHGASCVFWRA